MNQRLRRANATQARVGFTIVELLIVIVVIAILAAISVVAYNGIQSRAYNTKVITGTNAYLKAFHEYKAVNGSYPSTGGCLGANYPNNACWATNSDGTSPVLSVSSSLDAGLSEFVPTKPDVGNQLINIVIVNQHRGGAYYNSSGTGYSVSAPYIGYYLKGNNANCGMNVAQQVNEGPLTVCLVALPS